LSQTFRALRNEVFQANVELTRAGLVTMHSGNASGFDRESASKRDSLTQERTE
jgi:ribulose-5-phosphate 4-epimerase/fuculose-1-phosphate aldolase